MTKYKVKVVVGELQGYWYGAPGMRTVPSAFEAHNYTLPELARVLGRQPDARNNELEIFKVGHL